MRGKIFGIILTAMGIIGMASIATHITEPIWMAALFVIFALLTADGAATIAADCSCRDDEKYKVPDFLDEYTEDTNDGKE